MKGAKKVHGSKKLTLYYNKRTGEARENLTDENFTTRALEGS